MPLAKQLPCDLIRSPGRLQARTARWSKAGQLDWWVKERQEWRVGYAVLTAVNGGSELLTFVP